MNSASRPATASLDDPFYYLVNFRFVLDWVGARYADLLTRDERIALEAFVALPRASQALLVRMVMRKGDRFRLSRLRYAEIGDTAVALGPLIEGGWMIDDPALGLEALFALLTLSELRQALSDAIAAAGLPSGARKAVLFEGLGEALTPRRAEPRPLGVWWPAARHEHGERVVELADPALFERLKLMFFGNLRQDWSEFVLAELGRQRFEAVEFGPDSRAFRHRDEVMPTWRCSGSASALRRATPPSRSGPRRPGTPSPIPGSRAAAAGCCSVSAGRWSAWDTTTRPGRRMP